MLIIYKIIINLYYFSIQLISPFNPKAKLWIEGRKNLLQNLKQSISGKEKLIWLHCSSLGEFEQGRPVIEQLKKQDSTLKILITFFSPSGYEVQKNYRLADYIFYLPTDSKYNAKEFLNIINPTLIIYVKYEFWFYYLQEAKSRNIPLLLISAIFRKQQPFFSVFGNLHRKMLSCFTHLFVQNQLSVELLAGIGFHNVSVSGDTRFDRVIEIANEPFSNPDIESFIGDSKVVVAGSTWTEDDKELDHYCNTRTNIKFIIAPHNIESNRLKECLNLYKNSLLYSALTKTENLTGINTLIIDNIGMLSRLYKYGTVCFIGGGFGADGVHNVLEAAVYGKPVIFGPEYDKYLEANELIESNGAISVNSALELEQQLDILLQNNTTHNTIGHAAKAYVENKKGATEKIVQYIYANRLLTT